MNFVQNRGIVLTTVSLFLSDLISFSSARAQLQIMPLGDSITAGGGENLPEDQSAYRDQLYIDLTAQHVNFTFTGVAPYPTSPPDPVLVYAPEGNGFGSWTLGNICTNLAGTFPGGAYQPYESGFGYVGTSNQGGYWLTGTTNASLGVSRGPVYPDIVLLMAGVNDLFFGCTTGSTVINGVSYLNAQLAAETNMSNVLTWFGTYRPNTRVFVGSLMGFVPTNANTFVGTVISATNYSNLTNAVALFNAWLPTSITNFNTNAIFVDTAAAVRTNGVIDPDLMTEDGMHPDTAGYYNEGNIWYAALKAHGVTGTPGLNSNVPNCNYSFEDQPIPFGTYTNFGSSFPIYWSSANVSGAVVALVNPSTNDGRGFSRIPVLGLDGLNYCQIYAYQAGGTAMVYQDTGVQYHSGTIYSVTAAFGMENSAFPTGSSMGFYNSNLTPVVAKTIVTSNLTLGQFNDVTLTYNGTGTEGGNGDLIVGFNVPATAGAAAFDFDNVRLVVSNTLAPSITTQPVSKTTAPGSTVSFTVVATGTSPVSYQWYANTNTLIAGATNAALTLSNVESSGSYDVVVSNPYGFTTSSIASLTIQSATTPVSIPVANNTFSSQSVPSGSYVNLGTAAPTGWSASGVSSAVVALVNPSAADGRGFTNIPVPGLNGPNYCQIYAYQGGGSGVVYQDTGIKYVAGVTYNFTAFFGLENSPFPTGATMSFYNSNLTPIASQTISSNSLTLGTFTSRTLGYTATGSEGGDGDIIIGVNMPSTAGAAALDFGNASLTQSSASAPVITVQPVSQSVYTGQNASFSVGAFGSIPLGYQWQAGPAGGPYTNLVNGGQVSGANSSTLNLSNVNSNLAAAYQVKVTNSYGSVTSTPAATLRIQPGTLLPIVNAGFESDTITGASAPGYEIVNPTGWIVGGTNSSSYVGLINPAALGSYTASNGYSGTNALFTFSGDGVANPTVSQILTNTLQANTTYTVSVQTGNRSSGSWGGYNILLETTNGTLVGDWVGVYNNVAAPGTFATTARSFTTGTNPPGLGQHLEIVLSQGAPAADSYSDFDNVSVVASVVAGHTNGTPIDVYVCAGQSNEHGWYANVANLSQTNVHYANSPDSRALFAYQAALVGAASYSTGTIGQLSPDGAGHVSNFTGFGPELSDGSDLATRFGNQLAIIKFASGGANLDTEFQKSANYLYPLMITKITNSLQQLTAQGYVPTIKGFFWLQGETDAGANPTNYTNDIANFVKDIRSDLQVPNLEFVLTQINSNMPAFATNQVGVAEVNAAMTTLANSDPNVKFVTTDDMTNGFADNNIHYNADQTVTIGQRWAAAYTPQVAPSLTRQPVAITTNAGSSASFTVLAAGSAPLIYQWYAGTNTPIIGATNSSLSLTNVLASGIYDVVVSNPYGALTSSIATLTLLPNAPATLSAAAATKSVTLTYAAVSGAKFYTIYRSKIGGGPYTKIATTTSTKYADLNVVSGTTYYYVVADTDGVNLSIYSTPAAATPR